MTCDCCDVMTPDDDVDADVIEVTTRSGSWVALDALRCRETVVGVNCVKSDNLVLMFVVFIAPTQNIQPTKTFYCYSQNVRESIKHFVWTSNVLIYNARCYARTSRWT